MSPFEDRRGRRKAERIYLLRRIKANPQGLTYKELGDEKGRRVKELREMGLVRIEHKEGDDGRVRSIVFPLKKPKE